MSEKYVPLEHQVSSNRNAETMIFEATILQVPKTGKCARRIGATFQMRGDQPMTKYDDILNQILSNMGYKNAAILDKTLSPLVRCNGTTWRMVVKIIDWGRIGNDETNTGDLTNEILQQHEAFDSWTLD